MRPPFLFVALSAVLFSGCYSAGDGVSPPLDSLYFPTGLALDVIPNQSPDPSVLPTEPAPAKHLYVASSDFDLQYKSSALASFDLDYLRGLIPQNCNVDADCTDGVCDTGSVDPSYFCVPTRDSDPCGDSEHDSSAADRVLYPGRCKSIDTRIEPQLITDAVEIGAFATDAVFKQTQTGGDPSYPGRLFLPVRGDATLHWVDVDADGHLHCNASPDTDKTCDDAHRIGNDEYTESPNLLRQEPEPFAIAVDDIGENIAITNQTTGSVSLYVNHWAPDTQPELVYLLGGLPTAPVGIAAIPAPQPTPEGYEPGFLAVYRDAPQVDLLRVHLDPGTSSYAVRVLTRAATVGISANSVGSDSRDVVIDDSQRQADYRACYKPCAGITDSVVLAACESQLAPGCFQAVHQPSVYVSNRAPSSLLIGALTPDFSYVSGTSELPAFTDSIPLNVGPSRVVLGRVRVTGSDHLDERGQPYSLEQRVFVVCFDSRRIYIYDPGRHIIDSIVTTGRGPFALAIDEQRGLGYVAHFTDSYLGVISLDQRFPQNYAAIVASVGVPSAPRASK